MCLLGHSLSGQNLSREVYYGFDSCDMMDGGGMVWDGEVMGNPECVCGLVGNSLRLDGQFDALRLPGEILEILSGDFSIDFYISIEPTGQIIDILSFRATCGLDSLLTIKYSPLNNEITVDLARNAGGFRSIRGLINRDLCWNRITLTRTALRYTLYLDNQRVDAVDMPDEVPFGDNTQFLVGQSPCSGTVVSGLRGRIDELRISSEVVGGVELSQSYLYPDQIINRDTTIFGGGEVFIELGAGCTDSFNWNTTEGIENPISGSTFIRPTNTSNYILTFNDGICTTSDQVTIYVVSPEEVECANLLIPNAFTPNGDNLNDVFGISNTFIVEEIIDFRILERRGNTLYTTLDKNGKWDGSFKGQPMPPGVYIYQITYTCRGSEYHRTGSFTLMR